MSRRQAARSEYRMRLDGEGARRRVVVYDGMEGFIVRWTASCSGCFESGEYGSGDGDYPFDEKARCHIGAGCSECGYKGKVRQEHWEPFDMGAWFAREERRERRRARWFKWINERKAVA